MRNLGFQGLFNILTRLTDGYIEKPDIDIFIGTATISFTKADGFGLVIHDLRIGEHKAVDATVKIGPKVISISAAIKGNVLSIHDFHITEAVAEIEFERKGSNNATEGSAASVILGGNLKWEGHEIKAAAHVYKLPGSVKGGLDYTIVGSFITSPGQSGLPLQNLVPALTNTFMENVALEDVSLIVATRRDAKIGKLSKFKYPIQEG